MSDRKNIEYEIFEKLENRKRAYNKPERLYTTTPNGKLCTRCSVW